jgi:hypothetical protein
MKSRQQVGLKTVSYFPKTVRAIGAVFCIFGLAMIWATPIIGLLFVFITGVIFTTHYGFEISVGPNAFREFVWVLGWKDGKKNPFKAVEFIFIQPGKFTYLTYGLRERTLPAFEGYIKFEGRNEVQVLTEVNKDKLLQKLKSIAEFLKVPIRDYSDGNPVTIFEP